MLVSLKHVLDMAQKGNFCIPAFNVYNMETVMGAVYAAEEAQAPVILQVYPRLFNEDTAKFLAPVVLKAAELATVPICFHLDHGPSEKEVTIALRRGCTGIMLDGSVHPFDENVALTKHIVDTCAEIGVEVEGELGHIGSVNDDGMDEFTVPEDAATFVEQTGVAALAVLVGNAHGRYKKPPKIDIDRIKAIYEATNQTPLVLHGGSGIPDDQIQLAVKAGIRKMNFGTDVCYSLLDGLRAQLDNPNASYAIDLFMKDPIKSVKNFCLGKIDLLGARGQAK